MPDFFVPADTVGYSPYYSKITQKGLVYQFALDYADKNRKELSALKTSDEFEKQLDKRDVLKLFVDYAAKKGVKPGDADLKTSSKIIGYQVKAYIARNILGEDGFYPIIKNIDKTLLEAIKDSRIPIQQKLASAVVTK